MKTLDLSKRRRGNAAVLTAFLLILIAPFAASATDLQPVSTAKEFQLFPGPGAGVIELAADARYVTSAAAGHREISMCGLIRLGSGSFRDLKHRIGSGVIGRDMHELQGSSLPANSGTPNRSGGFISVSTSESAIVPTLDPHRTIAICVSVEHSRSNQALEKDALARPRDRHNVGNFVQLT